MNSAVKIIGRHREKQVLRAFLDGTHESGSNIFLIAGEAGMGKSLLAEEVLGESDRKTYFAKTMEGVSPPYGPIIAILRDYLRKTNKKTIDCGNLTPFLSFLLPELGKIKDRPDAGTLTETLFASLKAVIEDEPTLFYFDDLHWADNATLDILPVLADRFLAYPVLILGTYRSDEIPRGHHLRRMRNELRRRRMLHEITLESISSDETSKLVERIIGESPGQVLSDLIHEKTAGVPLFVEELSRFLSAQGRLIDTANGLELSDGVSLPVPESIRDAVILRLDAFSDKERELIQVASVAGLEFDFELLSVITGNDEALNELLNRSWIKEKLPGRGIFRHSLIRESIYHDIIWSHRRMLHRRIAEYLELSGGSPEQIAEQWLAAREFRKARKALLLFAERSCELHAYRDAARAAHQALEHWHAGDEEELRLQTLERLARCSQLGGQLNDTARALRELVESPILRENTRRYAETMRALATVYGLQGAWERFPGARLAAAEAFEQSGNFSEAAIEILSAAERNMEMGDVSSVIDLCDKACNHAVRFKRHDIHARTLALKGNALTIFGKPDEGIKLIHSGLSVALEHNLSEVASDAYKRLADSLTYASKYDSAREAYHSAYNYCRSQGEQELAQICLGCMSYVLFRTGDWKQCLEVCQEIINDPDSHEGPLSVAHCVSGFFHGYRGNLRAARKHLVKSMPIGRKMNNMSIIMACLEGFALLEEYEGKDASAASFYHQLLDFCKETNDVQEVLPALCSAVTFYAIRGMETETLLCSKALTDMSKVSGNNENLGVLAHALGETALLYNNPKEAIHQFEQACKNFKTLKIPLEWVKAEWRLGVAYRQINNADKASTHLLNAFHKAKNLGCRPLASRIAGELDLLGVQAEEQRSPDSASRVKYGGLTHRQLEVLRLLSRGFTNKEIAEKLFLSTRTVEMHVANILTRINCRSRLEAVRKAGNMGILN